MGSAGFSQGGATFDLSGNVASFTVNGPFSLTAGTFTSTSGTLVVAGDVTMANTPTATFNANSGTFQIDGGSNATVTRAINTGNQGLNNVVLNIPVDNSATSFTSAFTITGTMTVNGTLTTSCAAAQYCNTGSTPARADQITITGTVNLAGNYVGNAYTVNGAGTVSFNSSGAQTIGGTWGQLPAVMISNTGAGNVTLTVSAATTNFTMTSGTFNGGANAITMSAFTGNGGTFSGGSMTSITVNGAYALNGGTFTSTSGTLLAAPATGATLTMASTPTATFNANGGTLQLNGGSNAAFAETVDIGNQALNSLTFFIPADNSATSFTSAFTITGTMTVNGTLTTGCATGSYCDTGSTPARADTIALSAGTINLSGSYIGNAYRVNGSATVSFNSSGAQTIGGTYGNLPIVTIAGSGGVTLTGAAMGASGNFTLTNGSFNGGSGTITVAGILALNGGTYTAGSSFLNLTATTANPFTIGGGTFNSSTGSVRYSGGTGVNITSTPYYNLEVMPGANGAVHTFPAGTFNIGGYFTAGNGVNTGTVQSNTNLTTLNVGGNFTINPSGTFVANTTNTLSIGGSWSNSGTFTAGTGAVRLNGTAQQTLSGTSSFNTLTITNNTGNPSVVFSNNASANTFNITTGGVKVQFNAGSTYTFTNITFTGASGNLIQFQSSSPGTRWSLVVTGTQSVTYVNPQDSDASGGNTIVTDSTSLDGGNNLNWAFGGACTTLSSGNWNDGTKWTAPCNVSGPGASHAVIIASGHTMTVTANAAAAGITVNDPAASSNGITINSGITLTVGSNYGLIAIKGSSGAGNSTLAVGAGILNSGSINIVGGASTGSSVVSVSTGTISTTDSITLGPALDSARSQLVFTGNGTLNIAGSLTSNGTLTTTGNGSINFNGGAAQSIGAYTTYNNVAINNTSGGVTIGAGTTTIGGTLTIAAGTLGIGFVNTTVTGATSVSGTLTVSNGGGTSTFSGDVTVNNGGTWNELSATAVSFGGSLQNNGTLTAIGTYTFTGSGKTIGGANPVSIPNLTVDGTLTNSGTLTLSTALSGVGTLANGTNATLNLGGAVGVATLTATAVPNTVVYTGASGAQTTAATTYHHLTINNPGQTATLGGATTANGNFTIAANSTLDASTFALALKGNYTNNGTFTATTSTVILSGTAQQTLSGAMTGTSAFQNLTITNNSGTDPVTSPSVIFLGPAMAATSTITTGSVKVRFNAGSTYAFTNINWNGGLTATRVEFRSSSTGVQWRLVVTGGQTVQYVNPQDSDARGGHTIAADSTSLDGGNNLNWAFGGTCTSTATGNWNDGTKWTAPCDVSGPGASNLVIIASGHTMTVTAAAAAAGITINDPVASSNGITISGSNTLTVGAGSGAITMQGSSGAGSSTLSLNTGTVTVGGLIGFGAPQTQLIFTGTGTLNLTGDLPSGGTVTTVAGSIINFNGTAAQLAGGYTYGILKVNNAAGLSLSGPATVSNLTIGDATANSVFNDSGYPVTSSGTLNLASGKFRLGTVSTATSFPAFTANNISAGTTVEYLAGVAQTVSAAPIYSNLLISGVGVKTLSGSVTVGQNLTVSDPGGANLTLSGDVTLTVNGTMTVAGAGSIVRAAPATTFVSIVATTMQVDLGNYVDASATGCGTSMSYVTTPTPGCLDKGTPGPFANFG
ncbi:MAG TPA: hypothetical protein VFH55_07015, partial [Nitrospiria bacterium]|nr:hypothetical protein [Nitrospiria bacterium]